MDILFSNVTAVLMDDADTVLKDAFVLVSQGKIAMVSTARPEGFSGREIDGRGKVLMPGLVNAHTHVPMTLLRAGRTGSTFIPGSTSIFSPPKPASTRVRYAPVRRSGSPK
jgi:5-methylthioadenosine/S-adenosylhomocysteine deaminase